MKNTWNKIIYKLWSPIYDTFFNTGYFLAARKKVLQGVHFERNQKILFVGIGTGADLELINLDGLEITAIDYSPDMLNQARKKFKNSSIHFLEMDAQEMDFESNHFDWVTGSLILSVVPNAEICFQEMARVMKPGGKVLLFDKFLPREKKLLFFQKIIRPVIKLLGTDVGIKFEEVLENNKDGLFVIKDVPVMFNGIYRKIILSK